MDNLKRVRQHIKDMNVLNGALVGKEVECSILTDRAEYWLECYKGLAGLAKTDYQLTGDVYSYFKILVDKSEGEIKETVRAAADNILELSERINRLEGTIKEREAEARAYRDLYNEITNILMIPPWTSNKETLIMAHKLIAENKQLRKMVVELDNPLLTRINDKTVTVETILKETTKAIDYLKSAGYKQEGLIKNIHEVISDTIGLKQKIKELEEDNGTENRDIKKNEQKLQIEVDILQTKLKAAENKYRRLWDLIQRNRDTFAGAFWWLVKEHKRLEKERKKK